jgi:hypothetical protein
VTSPEEIIVNEHDGPLGVGEGFDDVDGPAELGGGQRGGISMQSPGLMVPGFTI